MATRRRNPMKVWVLPANEDWICDQMTQDWYDFNPDMSTLSVEEADVIWLLSDWAWKNVPWGRVKKNVRIVTSVHHIVPEKFDANALLDWQARDRITTAYHTFNQRTFDWVRTMTKKPVCLLHYWANGARWKRTGDKSSLREKHNIPLDKFVVGSFQRDTEGHDLKSPKLEKGPDLLADFLINLNEDIDNLHVLLAGWRRQYIMSRLTQANVSFTYIERPPQPILNDLYQTLDLYPVTARHEGGPQSLIECGVLNIPVVSRHVGIAEQVLPVSAINNDVSLAKPAVPNVDNWYLPMGFDHYRRFFSEV